jgi:hypothetical protein
MKISTRFVLFIIALLCLGISFASAATVKSVQSGNWSANATWNTGTPPAAGDSVVIQATDSVAVDTTAVDITTGHCTCKSLNVLGTIVDTVTAVSAGGHGDFVVTNVLAMASGSSFWLGQNLNALPAAAIKDLNSASTIILFGTQSSFADSAVGNLYVRTSASGISFTHSMLINGNLTCKLAGSGQAMKGTTSSSGSRTHEVMGNVYVQRGIFSAVDVGTLTTVGIWNIHGNVLVAGESSQIARFGPFSSAIPKGLGIINIDGDLTIDGGGRFQAANSSSAGTGTGIINLKGDLTFTSTGEINTNNQIGAFAVNFIGSGIQTVTDSMTSGISNQNKFCDTVAVGSTVVFANPKMTWAQSAYTGAGTIPDTGTFVVLGKLNLGPSQITLLQNTVISSGASFATGDTLGMSGAITATGTKTFSTSANYEFNRTDGVQVTGSALPTTVKNLTINNASGVALQASTTVSDTLFLTAGKLDTCTYHTVISAGHTVTITGSIGCPLVGVEEIAASAPREFKLFSNFPNPFNPSTEIRFSVPKDGYATVKVSNILGQEVATLFSGIARAGQYIPVTFNAANMASGVYFARLEYNGLSQVQRMLLMK